MTLAQFLRYILNRREGPPAPPPIDTTPNPFVFDPVLNAATNALVQSNAVLIGGINTAADVTPEAGLEYRVDDAGSWLTAGTISNGQTLRVRMTSSASEGALTSYQITVGTYTTSFSVTTEVTVPPEADFLITSDAELTALLAAVEANGALYSGTRAVIRDATYTAKVFRITGNAQPMVFEGEDPDNPPFIPGVTFGSGPAGPTPAKRCDKLTLKFLRLPSSAWVVDGSTPCAGFTYSSDIVLEDCEAWAGYRGNLNEPFDPMKNDYPEYASLLPVFNSTGSVVDLNYHQPYVGDLMADGVYPLEFADVNDSIEFNVRPEGTITVSGGMIVDHDITNTGDSNATTSSNNNKGIISKIIKWGTLGQPNSRAPMVRLIPFGMQAVGAIEIGAITLRRCYLHDLNNAFKVTPTDGSAIVLEDCVMDNVYQDFISVGVATRNPPFPMPPLLIRGLKASRSFWRSGDPDDPHGDLIQGYMNDLGTANTWTNTNWDVTLERVEYLDLACRGGVQLAFLSEVPSTGIGYRLRMVGFFGASKALTNGLGVDALAEGSYVNRVTCIRYDPNHPDNLSAVTFRTGSRPSGKSVIANSIFEGQVVDAANTTNTVKQFRTGNVYLGHKGAIVPYADVFVNPVPPTTFEEARVNFTTKGAYVGKGAYNDDGYITYTGGPTGTGEIDTSLEQPFIAWAVRTDVAASTSAPSEWAPILGGGATVALANASHSYQIADDNTGANATAASTADVSTTPGKYIRFVPTAAANGGDSVVCSLELDGYEYRYQVRTANAAAYDTIDNGGTEYLRLLTPPSEGSLKKFLLSFWVRTDALTIGGNILAADNVGALRIQCTSDAPTGARWRMIFGSSSAVQFRTETVIPIVGEWQRHIIAIDFSKTNKEQVAKWWINDRKMEFAVGTVISATGSLAYNITQIIPAALGLFKEGDGGGTMFNGAAQMLYMDWGPLAYTLPDIDDPLVRDMFEPDNIGATGDGPTGAQAKLYYPLTLAGANGAGVVNAGSVDRALEKQTAGTFT